MALWPSSRFPDATESSPASDPARHLRRIPGTDTEILADAPWHEHYRCRVAAPKPAAQKPAPSELARSNAPESNPAGSATGPTDSGASGSGAPGYPSESPSDPELVERMVRGDRSAVALLYERHKLPLFALARGMLRSTAEAEDLLHDVFLEAWRRCAD